MVVYDPVPASIAKLLEASSYSLVGPMYVVWTALSLTIESRDTATHVFRLPIYSQDAS